MCNYEIKHYEEHLCEIWNLGQEFRRGWRLKAVFYFSFVGHFVQSSKTVFAIKEKSIMSNICVIFIHKIRPVVQAKITFEDLFLCLALVAINFSGAESFV